MIRRLIDTFASALRGTAPAPSDARRAIHGIDVVVRNDGAHASTEALFSRAAAALDLIADARPWRLRAMRRDFAGIVILRNDGCRAMFDASRNCVLDSYFVATFAPAQVAASIVHEGVHARLRRDGRTVPPELIAWEERQCRKAELGFGLRIADGAAVVERARGALALSDAEVAPLAGNVRLRPTRRRGR